MVNIYLFFAEEWAAAAYRFTDGVKLGAVIEGFAQSIDTAAWVILLLMFELETYVLDDKHFTRRVSWSLHGLRAICYGFIIYAFYGYVTKLQFLMGTAPVGDLVDLCTLTGGDWAFAVDLDEYEPLTPENCAKFSVSQQFLQFPGLKAVVDPTGFTDIMRLAWVDVVNSGVWLMVVFILEFDVRLQERHMLVGKVLQISKICKYVLYSALLAAAIYWGAKGDFVDFWDAFLWLVAFVFIELNVFEWRNESNEAVDATINTAI